MHLLKNFYTSLSGAPQNCFKSGSALANAGTVSTPNWTERESKKLNTKAMIIPTKDLPQLGKN